MPRKKMVRISPGVSRSVIAALFGLLLAAPGVRAQALDGPAPELGVPDLEGTDVLLSELQGRIVVVDFWASWCGPCREELPFLVELHEELGHLPVTFVAINLDDSDDLRTSLLESLELELPFVQIHDPDGGTARDFELVAMPTTLVIDGEGVIRYRHTGFRDSYKEELRSMITALLEELS